MNATCCDGILYFESMYMCMHGKQLTGHCPMHAETAHRWLLKAY